MVTHHPSNYRYCDECLDLAVKRLYTSEEAKNIIRDEWEKMKEFIAQTDKNLNNNQ